MLKQLVLPACLALLAPHAAAQEDAGPPADTSVAPDRLVSFLTPEDLVSLVFALDAKAIAAGKNATGAPFIFAETEDGMAFAVYTICASEGGVDCRGVEFMAVLGSFASDEMVGALNRDYSAVSLYKADADTIHLSRYVILDHGVTWQNLVENGQVFHTLCATIVARLAAEEPAQGE